MATDDELRSALADAMAGFAAVVETIGDDDWSQASMCDGWSVHDVVDHIVGGDRFAVRILDGDALADVIPDIVSVDHVGDDAVRSTTQASAAARDAFETSLDQVVDHPVGLIPARRFISFRLLDQLGHTWDIAAALSQPVTLHPDAVAVALEVVTDERDLLDTSTNFAMPPADAVETDDPQTTFLHAIGRNP